MEDNYNGQSNGAEALLRFISTEDPEQEELELIAAAYTDELVNSISSVDERCDPEYLIYKTSLEYLDKKSRSVTARKGSSSIDCRSAIDLYNRKNRCIAVFEEKGWKLPKMHASLSERDVNTLNRQISSNELSDKTHLIDLQITALLESAKENLNIKDCDAALEAIARLEEALELCKQNRIKISGIVNSNTKALTKTVNVLRQTAYHKEQICEELSANDEKLYSILQIPVPRTDRAQEIIDRCNSQKKLLTELKNAGWNDIYVHYREPERIIEQYTLYTKMVKIDSIISAENPANNAESYESFIKLCSSQQVNIQTCNMNAWKLPELKCLDPEGQGAVYRKRQQKLLDHLKKKKARIRGLSLFAVISVVVLIAGIFIYTKYKDGKAKIPFNAEDVVGQTVKEVSDQIEDAGFMNVTKHESAEGIQAENQVLSVTINGQNNYDKGQLVPTDVPVVIVYSSPNRVYVTDLLKGWQKSTYIDLSEKLKNNGFTNVTVTEMETDVKPNENLVASVSLNGTSFMGEECYIPETAPIVISYYVYRIGIGSAAEELIGQDYNDVIDSLQKRGFTNVQAEEVTTGWGKENSVLSITVNDAEDFDVNETFEPGVKIVVKYSVGERIDITEAVQNYAQIKDYKTLINALKEAGITNVKTNAVVTYIVAENQNVADITINSEKYESGGCFVPKNAEINIGYYELHIKIATSAEDLVDLYKEENDYKSLVTRLEKLGFTNIQLFRANDLGIGLFNKEGSIKSIKIAGNDDFTASTEFKYNAIVQIVVHTKKSGCEDITMVAEK